MRIGRTSAVLVAANFMVFGCDACLWRVDSGVSNVGAAGSGASAGTGGSGGDGGAGGAGCPPEACPAVCISGPDICGNALDDDCDGAINDGCATTCESIAMLTDNFDNAVPGSAWRDVSDSGHAAIETGSQLQVRLLGATVGTAAFQSLRRYDFSNGELFVEVVQGLDMATTAVAYLALRGIDKQWLYGGAAQGQLFFDYTDGVIDDYISLGAFDPVAHRWWKIRHGDSAIFWETSPDSVVWTVQAEIPVPPALPVEALLVEVGGYSPDGSGNPGRAIFDRLNGGGEPDGDGTLNACPFANFKDGFGGGGLTGDWRIKDFGGASATETGGALVLQLLPNAIGQASIQSLDPHSLVGSSVYAVIPEVVATGAATASCGIQLQDFSGANYVSMHVGGGTLYADYAVDALTTVVEVGDYDPVAHRVWRMREQSGTVFYETSPDSSTWTLFASTTQAPAVDALWVQLDINANDPYVIPGAMVIERINSTPNVLDGMVLITPPSGGVSFWIDAYEAIVPSLDRGSADLDFDDDGKLADQIIAMAHGLPYDDDGGEATVAAGSAIAASVRGATPTGSISWFQAASACVNADKRLCTEIEWELACRGTMSTLYTYDSSVQILGICNEDQAGVAPAGSYSGCTNGYGVYDMNANLQEWTVWSQAGTARYRGGAEDEGPGSSRCDYGASWPDDGTHPDIGFRCCRNRSAF